MVVLVLMTSCHVSENLNSGPQAPQARITPKAMRKAGVEPLFSVTHVANFAAMPVCFTVSPDSSGIGPRMRQHGRASCDFVSILFEAGWRARVVGDRMRGKEIHHACSAHSR